jgi:hypothetical protein
METYHKYVVVDGGGARAQSLAKKIKQSEEWQIIM